MLQVLSVLITYYYLLETPSVHKFTPYDSDVQLAILLQTISDC